MSDTTMAIREIGKPGDYGWVVQSHGEQYWEEFKWDVNFEILVARIVSDFASNRDPKMEEAWIAEKDGKRVGCVFCVRDPEDEKCAKLRILLVTQEGRGLGLGGKLVDKTIEFAKAVGYEKMKLWTNHPLVAARKIYLSRGFRLIQEDHHTSFGADLIGQVYELML